MLVYDSETRSYVDKIVKKSKSEVFILCPWIFDSAFLDMLLKESENKKIRIVYRKTDGGKRWKLLYSMPFFKNRLYGIWPFTSGTLEFIKKLENIESRELDKLHGKMICGDRGILITSANMTPDSFERQTEFGFFSDNKKHISNALNKSRKIWEKSKTTTIKNEGFLSKFMRKIYHLFKRKDSKAV